MNDRQRLTNVPRLMRTVGDALRLPCLLALICATTLLSYQQAQAQVVNATWRERLCHWKLRITNGSSRRRMQLKKLLILALALFAGSSAQAKQPNIVLVFVDDMGWEDFSCFGNQDASTPNIDALAEEGLRFHQFYVNSPICSPSRVAISTGQYPQRWRITSFLNDRQSNNERGVAQWLDPKAPMLARQLQQAGYATGHFGKWHMGGQRDVDTAPPIAAYGFDESLTNFEGMGAKLLPLTEQKDKQGNVVKGRIWDDAENLGEPVTWMLRSEITGGFVEPAIAFIDKAQASEKPFYINLWPDDVHGPFFPSVERWSQNRRERYLAVLEEMDAQFKTLFDRVRSRGIPGTAPQLGRWILENYRPVGSRIEFEDLASYLVEVGYERVQVVDGGHCNQTGRDGRYLAEHVLVPEQHVGRRHAEDVSRRLERGGLRRHVRRQAGDSQAGGVHREEQR